ncbi:hypothetical protein [Corynebacterium alimapuense]|uniref:Uncharacterized protein n=1 Tax=Corynebacterium alimapuense TaxID=1576874 RepID=A0A3M8KAC1_9CORY|nr:hypothetical protein [Corynebacterium alimapuense]RNE49472.1 hypothetical protein C5L39_03710 [Corynebacterium alimapuense]
MSDAQRRMIQKIVAILAIVALLGALVLAFLDDATHKPVAINGDILGSVTDESFEDYRERAAESLAEAPATEPAYALVTFTEPLEPAAAAALLEPIDRVNAMVIALAAPFALPEPVAGETREDVFNRELDRIAASMVGIGDVASPTRIDAVVVRDTGDALRSLAASEEIAVVEVLPPDASWGRFGVRPVEIPGDASVEIPGEAPAADPGI